MIISDPQKNIVGFSLAVWLIDGEPCPKSKIRVYLTSVHNAHDELVRLASEQKAAGGEEESDEEEEEEESEDEEQWGEALTETSYPYFSVNELGDVLLISEFDDTPDLFFTGDDAKPLLAVLKENTAKRVKRLQALVER